MNCRDVRELADSYLSDELLTETNHEIRRHLDTCPGCRTEVDGRRRLRTALRGAFNRAPDLQADAELTTRIRTHLRATSATPRRETTRSRHWLALAAGFVLMVGLGSAGLWVHRSTAAINALVRDAVGDHRNCALKARLVRMPVPLEEAAREYDSAYRLLLDAPADDTPAPGGPVRVVDRHSCAYGGRRFGHVVLEYRGRVVSLLMTAGDEAARASVTDAIPHLIGQPIDGLSVVSVESSRHAVMLVSDLNRADLTELSRVVTVPLARRLAARLVPADVGALARLQFDPRRP
jgi:hypothetical protein